MQKPILSTIEELISKYESNIQASAEMVRKYSQEGNENQARYYMGLERAYQNIYKDLKGVHYEPAIEK